MKSMSVILIPSLGSAVCLQARAVGYCEEQYVHQIDYTKAQYEPELEKLRAQIRHIEEA